MPDPRLAEARQREAESRSALQFLVISQRYFAPTVLAQAKADVDADRRATDEALVAAALQLFVDENNLEGEVGPIDPASLLDAIEGER